MRTRGTITAAVGALLALAAAGPSWGQSPPETTGAGQAAEATPQLDRKACADDKRATTGSGDTVEVPQPGKDLSDKLAATDGVICPPSEVDPNMHAPAPGGGAMPVIPPPGRPGGDPSVRPK
jgi:hypothetical protein